jgi:hypothetical protein
MKKAIYKPETPYNELPLLPPTIKLTDKIYRKTIAANKMLAELKGLSGLIPNQAIILKWKQEPKEKYVGFELNANITEIYDLMKVVSEDQRLQKAVRGLYRIQTTLKKIIGKGTEYVNKLKEHKADVVMIV